MCCKQYQRYKSNFTGFKEPDYDDRAAYSWELLPTLQNMVGFRNVLVHDYAKLDHVAVYGVFKKRLGDFDAYAEAIVSYLEGFQTEAGGEG